MGFSFSPLRFPSFPLFLSPLPPIPPSSFFFSLFLPSSSPLFLFLSIHPPYPPSCLLANLVLFSSCLRLDPYIRYFVQSLVVFVDLSPSRSNCYLVSRFLSPRLSSLHRSSRDSYRIPRPSPLARLVSPNRS